MKTILHNLEITWWDTHIRLIDQSKTLRAITPRLGEILRILAPLRWSMLGFPLGIVLAALKHLG